MASNTENQDQLIQAQKDALDKAIADTIPLVGDRQAVDALQKEFASDAVYLKKTKALGGKYSGLRRTRPDGNCFFRAVAFRYFETLLGAPDELARFREKVIVPSKEQMTALGFPSFTVEDFHDTFLEQLDKLKAKDFSSKQLEELFNDQGVSDYLVVFLRLLTSKHLQEKSDFYQAFIDESKGTVKDFCGTDVEPMYVESDHIHVSALTECTGVKVRIMYLDRSESNGTDDKSSSSSDEPVAHDFPDDSSSAPRVHLLYRPGHYDVLYPKE